MSNIRLILGDCLEKLKEIPDGSVDAVITDPPYGLNKDIVGDTTENLQALLTNFLKEAKRVIKDRHSIVVFFDYGKNLPYLWRAVDASGCFFEKGATLYKPNDCSMPHNRWLRTSEAIWVLSKNGVLNHDGDIYLHDVIIANHRSLERWWYHPTAKSQKAINLLVQANTEEGDTILDPFMGSGTTGVACAKLNRNFIGIEIDEGYFKIAERRINEWKGQERLELSK